MKVALPDETVRLGMVRYERLAPRSCALGGAERAPLHGVPKFVEALFGKGRKIHVLQNRPIVQP